MEDICNIFDEDILELKAIEKIREQNWDNYSYNGVFVPRVTHIISHNEDKESLINWAARIGYNKLMYYREKSLNIGSIVHELIDEYLIEKYINNNPVDNFTVDYNLYSKDYRDNIFNCIENFKLWDKNLEKYNSRIEEVVGVEIPVTCPWYGGTIDAIVKINGAYYIIDFKTSKNISFNYLVQVSAYMWIINNGYSPNLPMIDGIGIIRVDKSCYGRYEDLFLNNFVTAQRLSIEEYQRTFAAYVNSYYRSLNAEYMTDIYKNCSYNPVKFFKGRNNGN